MDVIDFIILNGNLVVGLTILLFVVMMVLRDKIFKKDFYFFSTAFLMAFFVFLSLLVSLEASDEQYEKIVGYECVSASHSVPEVVGRFFNKKDSRITALERIRIELENERCLKENGL